ncbi:hypothetical protein QWZ13_17580 [Reinekea marina]|uniref:hypothetical protein n=1 Tax=Reinekea marina TaxID=1310421 RepID=UPI0025B620C1|nr:hypothetical protein [Reinekea marina]MDN3650721.1 hypothetical protein [Reinekea marina]
MRQDCTPKNKLRQWLILSRLKPFWFQRHLDPVALFLSCKLSFRNAKAFGELKIHLCLFEWLQFHLK